MNENNEIMIEENEEELFDNDYEEEEFEETGDSDSNGGLMLGLGALLGVGAWALGSRVIAPFVKKKVKQFKDRKNSSTVVDIENFRDIEEQEE